MKAIGLAALVIGALFAAVAPAQAAPVDVGFTVSGSAGNWLLDFSVTNNLGNTNDVYFFGVRLPTQNVAGTPAGFSSTLVPTPWNNSASGGSSIDYNNVWISILGPTGSHILPGQTLSGFQAIDTDLSAPTGINWFAYASGGSPDGNCDFECSPDAGGYFPGFEGVAAVASTPIPAALPLLATALGGLGFAGWRRRRAA